MTHLPLWRVFIVATAATCITAGCSPSGHRKATVIKMAYIGAPENLSEDPDCQVLWNDIARYGIAMDELRNDWNQVILNSASLLIENGCVRKRR